MDFLEAVKTEPVILTEGAVIERLNRDERIQLDPDIVNSGLIYDSHSREALSDVYRQYIDIGLFYDLPMITLAPTWRANPERIRKSGFYEKSHLNADCVRFLDDIRQSYGAYASAIFVGGLMACRGDAYQPGEALSRDEAADFHKQQARELADADTDFIMAATLPAISEALGLAAAIANCGHPYVVSFIIQPDGSLLDGTPLHEAIARLDAEIQPQPLFYMVNCVHPSVFEKTLHQIIRTSPGVKHRIAGLQANTSAKSPEELDGLSYLDTAEPGEFADAMLSLHTDLGMKIIGGCCGTDNRHMEETAKQIKNLTKSN